MRRRMRPFMPVTPRKTGREGRNERESVIIAGRRVIGPETAMLKVEGRRAKVLNRKKRKIRKVTRIVKARGRKRKRKQPL